MSELVIYDTTLGQALRFLHGERRTAGDPVKYEDLDVIPLQYKISLPQEIYDLLQANPLIKQQIQLDMIGLGKTIVGRIAVGAGQKPDPAFKNRVTQALDQGKADVLALLQKSVSRHAEMTKAWGKYKSAMTREMIIIGAGLALTAASIGAALPSGGASMGLAIAAGAKSVANAVNKLGECWRTAEQQEQRLRTSIEVLLKAYQKSVHAGRAMQVGGAVLDTAGVLPVLEVLPFVKQQLLPSMTKIQGEMAVYKGKLGSLYVAANQLAAQLFDLLDKIDTWTSLYPNEPMPGLPKVHAKIEELLDSGVRQLRFRNKLTIGAAYSRYEAGLGKVEALERLIRDINGIERNPKAVAIVSAAIKVLGNLAMAGGNYATAGFDAAADAGGWTSTDANVASLVLNASNDAMGAVMDFKEFGEKARGEAPDAAVDTAVSQITASYAAMPVSLPRRPPPPQGGLVARPIGGPVTAPAASTVPPPRPPPGRPTPPPRRPPSPPLRP